MKIGIDARFYGPSHAGLGRYTKNLVDQLAQLDNQNEYVIFLHTSNFDLFTTENPRFRKVAVPIAHYSLKEQLAFPKLLSQYNLDLVHFPHLNVPVGYRGKFVVTIHDLIMHKFKNRAVTTKIKPVYELKHLGYRAVTRWAAQKAQHVIVPSKAVQDEIVEFYKLPTSHVTVTHEAADDIAQNVSKKRPSTIESRQSVLDKYGISGKYIMYVGNVYPHKNIETLAKAMAELHDKHNLSLVLPSSRSVFLQRTEEMMVQHGVRDHVILPGFVPDEDLAILYQAAEAYVFPSLAEGFGLPPLEAMAAGLPVVCSDIPVLKEICGDAARYFDPYSADDIARAVGEVVSSDALRRQMIDKGYQRTKQFSWKKMAEETLEVYKSAAR
jgi:glycosyltransferase involved in cell wall biosynthesis